MKIALLIIWSLIVIPLWPAAAEKLKKPDLVRSMTTGALLEKKPDKKDEFTVQSNHAALLGLPISPRIELYEFRGGELELRNLGYVCAVKSNLAQSGYIYGLINANPLRNMYSVVFKDGLSRVVHLRELRRLKGSVYLGISK